MVAEFSTMGSCASRLLFNSAVNEGYKQFFHINDSLEVVSIISLMSSPINFDKTLLDSDDKFDNECAYKDLSKCFLDFLNKNQIDYLILDTYFDVECAVIVYDENSYLSDSGRISKTSYYKELTNKKRISIFKDFNKFIILWKRACDDFFNFLHENCPNLKVILNCSRGACYYIDEDNSIIEFDNSDYIQKSNEFRDILDLYILENFDVDVLSFDDSILAYKNHFAHLHTVHYEDRYYKEKTNQLNEIINRNSLLDYDAEKNMEYRKTKRDEIIFKFNLKNDWSIFGWDNEGIFDDLIKYKLFEEKMEHILIKKYNMQFKAIGSINGEGNTFCLHENIGFNVTIKGHRGDVVPNVVVEFLQDNQIVDLKSTNNGGIVKLIKSYGENGVHNIVARVYNTEFGKNIPVYIKETENRATFNQWSMGDYAINTGLDRFTDITYNKCGGDVSISADYGDIGNHCLKLYKPANDSDYTFVNIKIPLSKFDIGKTLIVKVKAFKTNNPDCFLNLFKSVNGKDIYVKRTPIFYNSKFDSDLELKWEKIPADVSHLQLRFQIFGNEDDVSVYADNLRVYIK